MSNLPQDLATLAALGKHLDQPAPGVHDTTAELADYEGTSLTATLLVRMGLATPEEAERLQHDRDAELSEPLRRIAEARTPCEISAAARAVAAALLANTIAPAPARAALYALQIATSAAHLDLVQKGPQCQPTLLLPAPATGPATRNPPSASSTPSRRMRRSSPPKKSSRSRSTPRR